MANGLKVDGSGLKWTLHCPDCKPDSTNLDLDLNPLNFSDSETQPSCTEVKEASIDIPTVLRLNIPDSLLKFKAFSNHRGSKKCLCAAAVKRQTVSSNMPDGNEASGSQAILSDHHELSPYYMSERTYIISRMIRASGPWAHGRNILVHDGWARRNIIPDDGGVDEWADVHEYPVDGWAEVVRYYVDGCTKVDVYQVDRHILDGWAKSVI
ncbi:hypothetical protein BDR07DRAFT_1382383 [Suillus spraguei]|nr:hypothetical protein BDR07DRAFT_1382383 [Suillus spraguei]